MKETLFPKSRGVRVCADIGGTKTLVSLIDNKLNIIRITEFPTYKDTDELMNKLDNKIREFSKYSDTLNLAIIGRLDKSGRVTMQPPNVIGGLKFKGRYDKFFKKVNIGNDGFCFAVKELMRGALKNRKNGIVLVWGTGIGGAVVMEGKIYKGQGGASEFGRIRLFDKDNETIETLVAGKGMPKHFGQSGISLHRMAMKHDKKALVAFQEIGKIFGRYIVSLLMLFDPEVIVIGGSFTNSWKFMEKEIQKMIKEESIRGKVKIVLDHDPSYVLRGSYLLNEYDEHVKRLSSAPS